MAATGTTASTAGQGNDQLDGGAGHDNGEKNVPEAGLHGGPGNDVVDGGPGVDKVVGEDGDDVLRGGADHDGLDGGPGNDQFDGGPGNDNGEKMSPKQGSTVAPATTRSRAAPAST